MDVKTLPIVFSDDRGEIRDILQNEIVNSLTILTCAKDSIRGNHLHKETTQFTYVIKGRLLLATKYESEDMQTREVVEGDLVNSPPMEQHAFKALEDSIILAGCYGPRAGSQYETDTYRLEIPLI